MAEARSGHSRDRLRVKLAVEVPAGAANRYRLDTKAGEVVLDGVDVDRPRLPFERGRLLGTCGSDGRPLRALVAVRVPTFIGCVISVYPVGLVHSPELPAPLVLAVPAADPVLAELREAVELAEDFLRAVMDDVAGATVLGAHAAEAAVREGIEEELRARAEAGGRRGIPAWKVSDERPPIVDGRQAEPHTFAEQAIPRLPARFQEYIARALLPDERILMFIARPVTGKGWRFGFRRGRLREGICVLTDRQVMFMTDSLPPDSTMIHWGYIARTSAIERVSGAEARQEGPLVALDVTLAARQGAETVSLEFPAAFAPAVDEAVEILRGFIPTRGSRALRRRYARELPGRLPSLAAVQIRGDAPDWAREALPDESPLAWARAPAEKG